MAMMMIALRLEHPSLVQQDGLGVDEAARVERKLGRGEYRAPAEAWPGRDVLRLAGVEQGHAGQWECTVTQRALNLTWTTAWIDLQVLPAPSFTSHLLEDDATRWLFGWAGSELGVQVLLVALGFTCLGACCLAYFLVTRVQGVRFVAKEIR